LASPQWKIKNLSENYSFKKAAEIILRQRIKKASVKIKLYLKEDNPETLHDARISIRRLRYTLELFYTLFDSKKFMKFYNLLVNIQDTTGSVRDIYITYKNISLFKMNEDKGIQDNLIVKMEEKRKFLTEDLRIQLFSLLKSNEMKNFIKIIR
jgi:CHAD domain-containing protein